MAAFALLGAASQGLAADDAVKVADRASVNSAAALRALERVTGLLADARWDQAAFEARLGASYDSRVADFAYVEAMVLVAKGAPRADSLERVEASLSAGLLWRSYDVADARVLCARLYAETRHYRDALTQLSLIGEGHPSADADYVRVLSLYGLKRLGEARSALRVALDRWPFDSRFARAFFLAERSLKPDEASLSVAATLLDRLYLWENEDRELLILSIPFQSDPAIRDRNIRIFRNMGNRDINPGDAGTVVDGLVNPQATLYALEYGVIDETTAFAEIFASAKTGIARSVLRQLCRLTGKETARLAIAKELESYAGVIVDDANGDGILDSRVGYRLGRPVTAEFDLDQDGYPDYTVSCDLGAPTTIVGRKGSFSVVYDEYPLVRSVAVSGREYTCKPATFSWAPVEWVRESLALSGPDFFAIAATGRESPLTERLLIGVSSFFTEPDPAREGGVTRVVLDGGVPVSSESAYRGRKYAWTTMRRGFPLERRDDRDDDGYFETISRYRADGKLDTVTVDLNANRTVDYRETYRPDGAVVYQWDDDENGVFEITSTVTAAGSTTVEWLHPDTDRPVIISIENGAPRSVRYGELLRPVVKDPVADVWWIGGLPRSSRDGAKKIEQAFNRTSSAVVVLDAGSQDRSRHIYAIRTGGLTFAELVDD